MVRKKGKSILNGILLFFSILFIISLVSAWDFYGYAYDSDGNALNNTIINITLWTMAPGSPPTPVGSNSSTSNESGRFNFSVSEDETWFYKPVVTHFNSTTGAIDYIGQSLPHFPYSHFVNTTDINFYLRDAGTINITAINSTGDRINFRYQVKDTKLGFPLESEFANPVSEAIVYVPRDRNYSVMIYPDQAMPISFDWNNFSAEEDYNITEGLATYNVTTHTVQKTFNATDNLLWVSGYINASGISGWNEFTIVPFLLEPGNMVYLGENAGMPYNMSAWRVSEVTKINETNAYINETGYQLSESGFGYNLTAIWADGGGAYNISVPLQNATPVNGSGFVFNATSTNYSNVSLSYTYFVRNESDQYNLASGFYNITLPGPAESVTYILFATARNGTSYYGGYRNITLSYGDSSTELNFTMYPLMSDDWGSANSNISLNDAITWAEVNISSAKQQFNLVNSSNTTLSNMNAHIEVKVDYSNYGAREFTFMTDISSGNASFYLPLLNASVKEMNIFSQAYAPKRVGTRTATQILANNNISMAVFNPGDIEGNLEEAEIFIKLYKSNSTCDLPVPDESCQIGGFGPGEDQSRDSFNPLSAVMGGGKLNFRMGYSGIEVVYINVDMIASGPPDVSFDDSEHAGTTTGSFETAFRFGSIGPTIYDYVLISLPYTPGSTSTTGLNENADVNMSIPILYDESWNVIWNTTNNGTNGTALAGNDSHYSTYSTEWETLMGQNNCTRNQSELNATNPCYIDITNNRIWIRLPHFSGTQPTVTGDVITATVSDDTPGTTPGGGRLIITPTPRKSHIWSLITPGVATIMKDFDSEIGIKEIQIRVNNNAQNVQITVTKHEGKPAEVSVEKSGKVHKYLQIETQNLEENLEKAIIRIQVNKSWVSDNNLDKDNVALFKFDENTKKWNELFTNYTETDDEYYYYDIELTSFSFFAIGEKIVEEQETTEKVTLKETSETESKEKGKLIWLWILIILVIAGIVGFIIYQKKK